MSVVVSIHAPTWGATLASSALLPLLVLFQFTRPRGARRSFVIATILAYAVSIHAPTWGATRSTTARQRSSLCFNSRAHVGRDLLPGLASQSVGRFNSRAHVGRDLSIGVTFRYLTEFQFTRPRGARLANDELGKAKRKFQFTRPRGARFYNDFCSMWISAHCRGQNLKCCIPDSMSIWSSAYAMAWWLD